MSALRNVVLRRAAHRLRPVAACRARAPAARRTRALRPRRRRRRSASSRSRPRPVGLVTELPGRLEASRVAQVRARAAGIVLEAPVRRGQRREGRPAAVPDRPGALPGGASPARRPRWRARRPTSTQADRAGRALQAAGRSQRDQQAGLRQRGGGAEAGRGRRRRRQGRACRRRRSTSATPSVTAPISGRIGRALVTEGALVGQGEATPLAMVQQIDPMYVNFTQSTTEVLRLRRAHRQRQAASAPAATAAQVRVVLEDGSEYAAAGQAAVLRPDGRPDLRPGHAARRGAQPERPAAARHVRARAAGAGRGAATASLLPQQAVTRSHQGDTVMVVGADGKVAPRPVKVGAAPGRPVGRPRGPEGRRAGDRRRLPEAACRGAPVKPVPWQPAPRPRRRPPRRLPRRPAAEAPERMAQFFIDRPIFAWVIALFILVLGGVSITQLPIAQYPPVAPPSIVITATYPGASAQTLEDSVISVIEQEMNGSPGLIYMESVAQANGTGPITLTFEPGTNPDLAQVDVQNRLTRATPRLPAAVTQQGVRVDKARSNFLLFTILSSDNPAIDPIALGDYASRNVLPEIQRIAGRRPGAAVRHRARDAHLDRPGQAGRLQPVGGRRQRGDPRAERAGVVGHDRRPAERCRARRSPPPSSSNGQLDRRSSSSATSCCAPTPTARRCGCATSRASSSAARTTPPRRA